MIELSHLTKVYGDTAVVNDVNMNGNPAAFSLTFTAAANVKIDATGLHLCFKAAANAACN